MRPSGSGSFYGVSSVHGCDVSMYDRSSTCTIHDAKGCNSAQGTPAVPEGSGVLAGYVNPFPSCIAAIHSTQNTVHDTRWNAEKATIAYDTHTTGTRYTGHRV
jgi:hypothetical protein